MAEAASAVVTIDAPSEEHCGLPADRRICFAAACPANLSRRLPHGVDHPTRCAFDQGGLIDDHSDQSKSEERRRGDCARLYACEEAWILSHATHNISAPARCPTACLGFVSSRGGVVPDSALNRAKRGAAV